MNVCPSKRMPKYGQNKINNHTTSCKSYKTAKTKLNHIN